MTIEHASYSDRLDAIEAEYGVVVEVSDEAGRTFVYAYSDDGDRIAFEFNSMNPDVDSVREVASAISAPRRIGNLRPRVGKVAP